MLRSETVDIAGIGELQVTELSARAYAAMLDARKAGKQEVEVSAVVSYHCALKEKVESVEQVLDQYAPAALMEIMQRVVALSDLSPKNSAAGQARSSSTG